MNNYYSIVTSTIKDIFPTIKGKWEDIWLTDYSDIVLKDKKWLYILSNNGKVNLFGGFLEDRSPLFDSRHDSRKPVHLGVDFWVEENTPVHYPYNFGRVVHIHENTNEPGGWGNRVDILYGDKVFMFGHLNPISLKVGKTIRKGRLIGRVGTKENNGGWKPHLHLQCIFSFDYKEGLDAYTEKISKITSFNPLLVKK